MILPIIAYGHTVLRRPTEPIQPQEEGLTELIKNMFDTMYGAHGVGLAGPQVGMAKRIFVVDGAPMDGLLKDDPQSMKDFKKVFINPVMLEETGDKWEFEEGCLSIPDIRADVSRHDRIRIKYWDENFEEQEEEYTGLKARIIQHEYDHLEGVLFVDYLTALKKQLLKSKLARISKGKIDADYDMIFPKKR